MEDKQSRTSQETQVTKQKKAFVMIGIAVFLVIVALVGIIIYLLSRPSEQEPERPQSSSEPRAVVVTEDNVAEILAQANEPVKGAYYNCQMNVEWNFTDSTQPSYNAYVANSTINECTVYFDVNLQEDGTLVYSSPYIPVGEKLKEIILTENLDAGDYPAVVTYHLVDDDYEELSTVSVTVTLHIEQ